MDEIEAIDWNGYEVVSTFSGCGGSCLGYRMAGYRVLWASEFIPAAQEVYKMNHPDSVLDTKDIRKVESQEILDDIDRERGEIDILDGSPPCSDFSTAGKGSEGWGEVKKYSETKQRVDDLFFEYARILEGLQPKAFVAENVRGLVRGKAKGYFKEILRELKGCGYDVQAKVLDAQWLGVPQRRQRLIFVGVREDLGVKPAHPDPLPYRYTIKDALPWVKYAEHDTGGDFSSGEFTNDVCPTIKVSDPGSGPLGPLHYQIDAPPIEEDAWIGQYAIGDEWERLQKGEQSSKYFSLVRPNPDKPCPTVTQTGKTTGAASVTHPTEKRKFSIAELKRIQGFPDDFELAGSYEQQWERLARTVPPVMMKHIAATIRDEILD